MIAFYSIYSHLEITLIYVGFNHFLSPCSLQAISTKWRILMSERTFARASRVGSLSEFTMFVLDVAVSYMWVFASVLAPILQVCE